MIGTTLAHYRITASLGAGGMGEVFRATDTKLDRDVAIKVLPINFSRDPQSLARFEREARALAALNHPNIAAIHGFDSQHGTHFLVLELIEGETLAERLRRGPLPLQDALTVARQIADAMQEAHAKGIVHRDLKPGNVKITPGGRVKVLDFGLAKMEQATHGRSRTPTPMQVDSQAPTLGLDATTPGAVMGTPAYMSPEQARGEPVDKRTDVWAFGCCLYECLIGNRPFQGRTASELIAEVLKGEPDWSQIPKGTPAKVETLLRRCLEKDPARRLGSMRDIALTLDESSSAPATFSAEIPEPRAASSSGKASHSIGVLPFLNMGGDRENEHFSDGITEDLITALSQIDGLRVPARTSSFAFKEKRDDIRRIGRDLGVNLVLEGTVRRSGNRLRITAQLIDVSDGFGIWSERYDRELKDVFEIQEEITQRVVSALRMKLGVTDRERMARKPTSSLEAYDLYLLGRHLWTKRQPQDLPKVFALFEQALELDPAYALAHSGMADYFIYQAYYFGNLPFVETMRKAREYALKAIAFDERLGEPHVSLGLIKMWLDRDFAGAERELERAIALNPYYPTAYHFRAALAWGYQQHLDEALALLQRGLEIDPLSVPIHNMRALILSQAGRHDQVITEAARILELDPHQVWEYVGRAYEQTGRSDEAMHWYLRWLEEEGVPQDAIANLRQACAEGGLVGFKRRKAQLLVEQPTLLPVAPHWQQAYLVEAFVELGRRDDAFRLLEQAFAEGSPVMSWLKVDLRFEALREDPRFATLVRTIGFPE